MSRSDKFMLVLAAVLFIGACAGYANQHHEISRGWEVFKVRMGN